MVSHDRPVYQEEHAAQLIMARRLRSPLKGRIHLRRSVDRPFAFPLQSSGGPYIFEKFDDRVWIDPGEGLLPSCRHYENNPERPCQPLEAGRNMFVAETVHYSLNER